MHTDDPSIYPLSILPTLKDHREARDNLSSQELKLKPHHCLWELYSVTLQGDDDDVDNDKDDENDGGADEDDLSACHATNEGSEIRDQTHVVVIKRNCDKN